MTLSWYAMLAEELRYDSHGREAHVFSSELTRFIGREYSEVRVLKGRSNPAPTA